MHVKLRDLSTRRHVSPNLFHQGLDRCLASLWKNELYVIYSEVCDFQGKHPE